MVGVATGMGAATEADTIAAGAAAIFV